MKKTVEVLITGCLTVSHLKFLDIGKVSQIHQIFYNLNTWQFKTLSRALVSKKRKSNNSNIKCKKIIERKKRLTYYPT